MVRRLFAFVWIYVKVKEITVKDAYSIDETVVALCGAEWYSIGDVVNKRRCGKWGYTKSIKQERHSQQLYELNNLMPFGAMNADGWRAVWAYMAPEFGHKKMTF